MSIRGVSGELRRAYYTVARLGQWSMDARTGRCEAVVDGEASEHWMTQPGTLTLSLNVGRREWVWREAEVVQFGGGQATVVAHGSPDVR